MFCGEQLPESQAFNEEEQLYILENKRQVAEEIREARRVEHQKHYESDQQVGIPDIYSIY